MRITVNTIILAIALSFAVSDQVYAQNCSSLEEAASTDLVSFLRGVSPDESNAECVAWAITQLGARRFESSAEILVRYLNFRRPLSANEKLGINLHAKSIGDVYPAIDALTQIGAKSLPPVLQAIEAETTTLKARENAVFVWMEIHRNIDEHPRGVALLKQEETKVKDDATKSRLRWAVSKAITWCNPPQESACRKAAETGVE